MTPLSDFDTVGSLLMKEKKNRKIRSSIVRDSIDTFGTNLIGSAITLISSILVLNRVDPGIKALNSQVQTWGAGFSTLIGLSLNSAVTYFIARYKTENAKAAVKKLTVWISAAIVCIGTVLMILLRDSAFFQKPTQRTPYQFLAAIVIYGAASFVFNICIAVLRGENKFKSYNMINLIQRVLVTLLTVFIFLRPSAAVWVWGAIAISAGMIAFAFYCIRRWNGPRPVPAPEDDFPVQTGSMVRYSLKSHVSNTLTYINTFLGAYLVQGYYTLEKFAMYSTAFTLMQQVWILPDAVSMVIMSRIAGMKDQHDKVKLTLMASKIVAYITVVCAVGLVFVARLLFPLIFPMYVDALEPLAYLVIGSVFISHAKVLNNSIAAYGRPELNIIPTVAGIGANLLANLFLIPVMDMNGVALATSLSLTVQGVTSAAIFCTFTKTPVSHMFLPNREEIRSFRRVFRKD